nr:sugar phosphate isomerase/epimerase family protein [Caldilineaceae bacterium]
VRAWGAEVIEFAVEQETVVDTSALRRGLNDEGLGCSVVGLFGAARDLSLDNSTAEAGLAYAKQCMDLCAEVGAQVFTGAVVGVGGEVYLSATQREDRLQRAAENLHQLGNYAQAAGIKFVIEVLNRYETNFINTAAEARTLVDRVNHPLVGIHLDSFHMGLEENDLSAAICTAGERLLHFHASESHRRTPGTGVTPWAQVAQGLRDIGYDGYAVIESFNPHTWIGPLARFWRPMTASPDQLAQEGIAFLRKTLLA